ncbi:MAG: hypothetical protein KC910_04715 [Candidatus Eremiobacteraeota bacterium]|nr:hypothetical protein [Candidatus Eremiobacteraeota bacterium]
MQIPSKPYYARRKSPEFQRRLTASVAALEDQGRIRDARDLVIDSLLLDSYSGKDLQAMRRLGDFKVKVGKLLATQPGWPMLVGAGLGAAAAFAVWPGGVGPLGLAELTTGGFLVGGLAGLGASVLAKNTGDLAVVELKALDQVEQVMAEHPGSTGQAPVEAKTSGTVAELIQSARAQNSPYHTRQANLLEQDFQWFQQRGLAERPLDRLRTGLQAEQRGIERLGKLAEYSVPLSVGTGLALGLGTHMLGLGWLGAGFTAAGTAVAGAVLGRVAHSWFEQWKYVHPNWEQRLDRLEYAANPQASQFALAGALHQLRQESLALDSAQTAALAPVIDKLEQVSPRLGLGEAAWRAELKPHELKLLSKVWSQRARPVAESALEVSDEVVTIGDHQLEVQTGL